MFPLFHVVISVLGVVAGLVVVGLVANARLATWTAIHLAPTQAEPPFAITQALVLAVFVWLGRAAVQGFRGSR